MPARKTLWKIREFGKSSTSHSTAARKNSDKTDHNRIRMTINADSVRLKLADKTATIEKSLTRIDPGTQKKKVDVAAASPHEAIITNSVSEGNGLKLSNKK